MTDKKPNGFFPTGKNPGKNDAVQNVLDEFALEMREGDWKTLTIGWEDVYAVEIPQYMEILATLSYKRGYEQGKLDERERIWEKLEELYYAPESPGLSKIVVFFDWLRVRRLELSKEGAK